MPRDLINAHTHADPIIPLHIALLVCLWDMMQSILCLIIAQHSLHCWPEYWRYALVDYCLLAVFLISNAHCMSYCVYTTVRKRCWVGADGAAFEKRCQTQYIKLS